MSRYEYIIYFVEKQSKSSKIKPELRARYQPMCQNYSNFAIILASHLQIRSKISRFQFENSLLLIAYAIHKSMSNEQSP